MSTDTGFASPGREVVLRSLYLAGAVHVFVGYALWLQLRWPVAVGDFTSRSCCRESYFVFHRSRCRARSQYVGVGVRRRSQPADRFCCRVVVLAREPPGISGSAAL